MSGNLILIVDDEEIIRQLLTDILVDAGFDCVTASNGLEGLEMFHQHQPDLVVTDIVMPVMDGREFCLKLRESSSLPVMMISGQVVLEDERKVISDLGIEIDAVMAKPIQVMEFLNNVESLLQNAGSFE